MTIVLLRRTLLAELAKPNLLDAWGQQAVRTGTIHWGSSAFWCVSLLNI